MPATEWKHLLPNGITQDYKFDDYGNIIRMAQVNGFSVEESNYSYDKNNRLLLKETVSAGKTVRNCYEYDAAGNTVRKESFTVENGTSTNDSTEYSYNGRNQLCGVALSGGENFAYTYNVEGLRSSKVSEDGTVNYVYQNGIILLETDGDGAVTAENVWGIRLLERKTAEADYGYRFDAHGDIIALTDEHGTMLEDYSYDPYGVDLRNEATNIRNWKSDSLSLDNPFRYCGEYQDEETGLYYLRARYYDPGTGRFLSEDTIPYSTSKMPNGQEIVNPLSLNLYTYCCNNPIMFIDPSGHYDRQAAVNYANEHWFWRNHEYYSYRTDCANFISQCIFAGDIGMNEDWHSYKTFNKTKFWWDPRSVISSNYWYDWDVTGTWSLAAKQYEYFSNADNGYINGDVITISSADGIADVANYDGVQAGDLLYFVEDGKVHHATIITKVENGKIYCNGHTKSRKEKDLSESIGKEKVYIVRIKDDA